MAAKHSLLDYVRVLGADAVETKHAPACPISLSDRQCHGFVGQLLSVPCADHLELGDFGYFIKRSSCPLQPQPDRHDQAPSNEISGPERNKINTFFNKFLYLSQFYFQHAIVLQTFFCWHSLTHGNINKLILVCMFCVCPEYHKKLVKSTPSIP